MSLDIMSKNVGGDLRAEIAELKRRLSRLEGREVQADDSSEMAESIGNQNFGKSFVDEDGLHSDADLVDINWWLNPLPLADTGTYLVHGSVFDGVDYVYVFGYGIPFGGEQHIILRYSIKTRDWSTIGNGLAGSVYAAAFHPTTGDLYVVGEFSDIGGTANNNKHVVRLNASDQWVVVGNGMVTVSPSVVSISFASDGTLYIGGNFLNAGGDPDADFFAVLNAATNEWESIGAGAPGPVHSIALDPIDESPYIGGEFDHVAHWNGSSWETVGTGNFDMQIGPVVLALEFSSEGFLYAGGSFEDIDGDTSLGYIAKLEGDWSPVGDGLNGFVSDILFTERDEMLVCGYFTIAGELLNANRIARLSSGNTWEAVSNAGGAKGIITAEQDVLVLSMTQILDGSFIVTGRFDAVGSIKCARVAIYCRPISESIDILASLFELYGAGGGGGGGVEDGTTYNPTVSNASNLDSTPTVTGVFFIQVGNVVFLNGTATAFDPTSTGLTSFRISLPIASNFTAAKDAAGFCGRSSNATEMGLCQAVSGTSQIQISLQAAVTTSHTIVFMAYYVIK